MKPSTLEETSASTTAHELGLQILRQPYSAHNPSDPAINIIFVHGLGGSAKGTWTDKTSGSFWPLWLPEIKALENSRIMTFGYDSGWNKIWKSNNVLDISDFAKQLVHDLWLHYLEYGDVCILFNGHRLNLNRDPRYLLRIAWGVLLLKRCFLPYRAQY
jgi:hypothetical protein